MAMAESISLKPKAITTITIIIIIIIIIIITTVKLYEKMVGDVTGSQKTGTKASQYHFRYKSSLSSSH